MVLVLTVLLDVCALGDEIPYNLRPVSVARSVHRSLTSSGDPVDVHFYFFDKEFANVQISTVNCNKKHA